VARSAASCLRYLVPSPVRCRGRRQLGGVHSRRIGNCLLWRVDCSAPPFGSHDALSSNPKALFSAKCRYYAQDLRSLHGLPKHPPQLAARSALVFKPVRSWTTLPAADRARKFYWHPMPTLIGSSHCRNITPSNCVTPRVTYGPMVSITRFGSVRLQSPEPQTAMKLPTLRFPFISPALQKNPDG
jgi:hypothetical protein